MNPVSVLLVEDNPADADLTREAFEINRQDVALSVVLDGVEAMDFLNKRGDFSEAAEPDLVLLDLNLPRKDGRQVLTEIKTSKALRKIPVVVMSSSKDQEDIMRSYDLGANCYISKPVDFKGFRDTMKSLNCFWFFTASLPDRRSGGHWGNESGHVN